MIGEFELLIIKFGIRSNRDTKLSFDLYRNGIIKTIRVWMFRNPLNFFTSLNDSKSKFENVIFEYSYNWMNGGKYNKINKQIL